MMSENAATAGPEDSGIGLAVLWPDILIAGLLVLAGSFLESPVLLALAVYAVLILARDTVCIVIRRHGHGRNAHRYEYGTGKLEQAVNLALAATKVAVGLWLTYLVMVDRRMLVPLPTEKELGLYALICALYTVRSAGLAWIGRRRIGTGFRAIGSSARTRLLVAVLLQTAFTIAVISKDAVMIGAALAAAMMLLSFAMLLSGIRQSRNAVLDLVDHPPDLATDATIRGVVGRLEPDIQQMIVDFRARRSGEELFVELTVAAEPHILLDVIRRRISFLRDKFRAALPGSDVIVLLSPVPDVPSSDQQVPQFCEKAREWLLQELRSGGSRRFGDLWPPMLEAHTIRKTDAKKICAKLAKEGIIRASWRDGGSNRQTPGDDDMIELRKTIAA